MKERVNTMTESRMPFYNWQPESPDQRDLVFRTSPQILWSLPDTVDLRNGCPPVYKQESLGNTTVNAVSAAVEFALRRQNPSYNFMQSPLFSTNTPEYDNFSAEIRDCIKMLNRQGLNPTAGKQRMLRYHRIDKSLNYVRACLAEGFPFVFGFSVYEDLENETVAKTGKLNMPGDNTPLHGGLAALCVGYDDKTERFLVRNSWGSDWGMEGYFTMPYDYMDNQSLSDSFWTIRVEA